VQWPDCSRSDARHLRSSRRSRSAGPSPCSIGSLITFRAGLIIWLRAKRYLANSGHNESLGSSRGSEESRRQSRCYFFLKRYGLRSRLSTGSCSLESKGFSLLNSKGFPRYGWTHSLERLRPYFRFAFPYRTLCSRNSDDIFILCYSWFKALLPAI
jgi:hypothetical protein